MTTKLRKRLKAIEEASRREAAAAAAAARTLSMAAVFQTLSDEDLDALIKAYELGKAGRLDEISSEQMALVDLLELAQPAEQIQYRR